MRHGYAPDFPSVEAATELAGELLADPGIYGVVAERDGEVVGSNYLAEWSAIRGIGPITVDPAVQDSRIGRELMVAVLDRVAEQRAPGARLVQAAYHTRSLVLYTKLGFVVREPLVTFQGSPPAERQPGRTVRAGNEDDVEGCNGVCFAVHGHDRAGEVSGALELGTLRVVEHGGRVTGYTTGVAFFNHSVGETNADVKALIADASEYPGPGFLLPARNSELFRWCLGRGLRVVHVMTLMTVGLYNEPDGAYLPSVLY
ncbi:MAG TPA: GNAT family N-acetyltransferase [Gaiellaceae bacterium]|nr:GNAT family N-acetyltransferase [Gaiellaceae bacterium]